MNKKENHPIYGSEEYKLLADQIENHERAVDRLLKELEEKFPAGENRTWAIMGDRRPYQRGYDRIED